VLKSKVIRTIVETCRRPEPGARDGAVSPVSGASDAGRIFMHARRIGVAQQHKVAGLLEQRPGLLGDACVPDRQQADSQQYWQQDRA